MIDQELIKKLRSKKSWSQEQLSLVAGLSLRTVQRIENEGKCSFESKKAIAAAFDLNPDSLSAAGGVSISEDDDRLISAMTWLKRVDSADYENSWEDAGQAFKARVSRSDWIEKIKAVRDPLGNSEMRAIHHCSEHVTLPGAPDGVYVVLLFESAFNNKRSCEEKIVLEKSVQQWSVVGYFIN